jgi:hypothetical protein
MTPKQKAVLRTAFGDTFRTGDLVITQSGTEVDESKVADIVKAAKQNGVTLFPVTPKAAKALDKDDQTDQGQGGNS